MKSKEQIIREFEAEARKYIPPKGDLLSIKERPRPAAGQLWTTWPTPTFPPSLPANCATDDPFLIIILKANTGRINRQTTHLVAPVIDSVMAGPEDMILGREILGHRAAVAVGSAITVLHRSLSLCRGLLPQNWRTKLTTFLRALDKGETPNEAIPTGWPYLDNKDRRYQYHADLPEKLAYLQDPILQWAEDCGALA